MWKKILTGILLLLAISTFAQDDNVKLANEYFTQGEIDKAKIIYQEIAKDLNRISLIHNNYFYLLLQDQDFKEAHRYLNRVIRKYPSNLSYQLDKGKLFREEGKDGTADSYFNDIIKSIKANSFLVRHAANYFVTNQMYEWAQKLFLDSRSALKSPRLYSLELANLYRIKDDRGLMVEEYLNYMLSNPSNIRYVKNSLQRLLTETSDLESLESLLYERIQEEPDNLLYPDLMIWVNLQLKNFYGAFIQARALDRRQDLQGTKSLEIGLIAMRNGDFNTSAKIFGWIIDNYEGSPVFFQARMKLIESYEMKVKNTYPISTEEIRSIIDEYDKLIRELGMDRNTLEAMRNKALLHAFYLDERDTSIVLLNKIVNAPRANVIVKANSKLDLGDIYLLNGEPWESTLLYSQVEKEMKESPMAYEAKLRNARLSYFRGDFLLAQEHLDIIKKATTREISNDAMSLSLLIKDNIAFDSTESAMRSYAAIELLLYQNKTVEALESIDSLKTELQNHSLMDELYWLEANIRMKAGEFHRSVELLEKIHSEYNYDILSDDAYFMMGEIYERHIQDKEKAMDIYMDFLTKYPGSVYAAEARKRFRTLRGDFDEEVIN